MCDGASTEREPNNSMPDTWRAEAPREQGETLRAVELFLDCVRNSSDLAGDLVRMRKSGSLERILPEFTETWGPRGQQPFLHHPEGNVWVHTLMVVAALPQDASYALRLATIFHDIAKPPTFFQYPNTDDITFAGHAQAGADMLRRSIGPRLNIDLDTLEHAATVVEYHMFMHEFPKIQSERPEFLEHILQLPCIEDLIVIQHADVIGSGLSEQKKQEISFREPLLALLAEHRKDAHR